MAYTGGYLLVGVKSGAMVQSKRRTHKAPTEATMIKWGKERGCLFVLRYFPSKKGWRALDIRGASVSEMAHPYRGMHFPIVHGAVRGTRYWPTAEAAAMYLMAVGSNAQLDLL